MVAPILSSPKARKIYSITLKQEDRAALPFDRFYPDAGYAPRPITMRADYEQLPEDIGYPLNAVFSEDEDQEAEPCRRPPSRRRQRDESPGDSNEPRSNYYYVDRERREYRYAYPQPRWMIQSTKPNYTRWPQPAEIEE